MPDTSFAKCSLTIAGSGSRETAAIVWRARGSRRPPSCAATGVVMQEQRLTPSQHNVPGCERPGTCRSWDAPTHTGTPDAAEADGCRDWPEPGSFPNADPDLCR